MRHRKQKGKLSRDAAHRKALFSNLCREVIDHERIQTTEAKAKAVKPELERLITLAKKGDGHSRRLAMARLELVQGQPASDVVPREQRGAALTVVVGSEKVAAHEAITPIPATPSRWHPSGAGPA